MIALVGLIAALVAGTPIALAIAGVNLAGWASIAELMAGLAPEVVKALAAVHPVFAGIAQHLAAGLSAQDAASHAHSASQSALQSRITPQMLAAGERALQANRLGRDADTVQQIFVQMTLAQSVRK